MGAIARYRIPVSKKQEELPRFFDLYGAAAYLGVSYRIIKRAVDRGDIPCAKFGPATNRIARESLDQYVRSGGKVEPAAANAEA